MNRIIKNSFKTLSQKLIKFLIFKKFFYTVPEKLYQFTITSISTWTKLKKKRQKRKEKQIFNLKTIKKF